MVPGRDIPLWKKMAGAVWKSRWKSGAVSYVGQVWTGKDGLGKIFSDVVNIHCPEYILTGIFLFLMNGYTYFLYGTDQCLVISVLRFLMYFRYVLAVWAIDVSTRCAFV